MHTHARARVHVYGTDTGAFMTRAICTRAHQARPFQLQSISFMVENEREGANKKLWSKFTAPSGRSFHYSAALDRLKQRAPDPVRGGILASEMGLGKTVMALGLVLSNPVQLLLPPITNVKVKRASKGTLVIAAVSLVGQWVDEARSKITDSNVKIYAYHGGNRKKDVDFLASQDIVVSTYSILSSDSGYWKKRGGANYVAPLESIAWHRIILDESHSIKQASDPPPPSTPLSLCNLEDADGVLLASHIRDES